MFAWEIWWTTFSKWKKVSEGRYNYIVYFDLGFIFSSHGAGHLPVIYLLRWIFVLAYVLSQPTTDPLVFRFLSLTGPINSQTKKNFKINSPLCNDRKRCRNVIQLLWELLSRKEAHKRPFHTRPSQQSPWASALLWCHYSSRVQASTKHRQSAKIDNGKLIS